MHSHKRPRISSGLAVLLGAALWFAGCTRDNVSAGGDGAAGSDGPAGPPATEHVSEADADLLRMVAALPREMPQALRDRARAEPERFRALVEAVLDQPEEFTWLVDKQHALPSDYEPDDLVSLSDYPALVVNRSDLRLRSLVIDPLLQMTAAAAREGITLDISSTYRSYDYQAALFQRNVDSLGREQAERESARAGTSQHQLGTTVDFGSITPAFAATAASGWLAENAWRFGFSLSYPDGYEAITGYMYESWHYRYVGLPATELERAFFGGIQQWMLLFLNALSSAERP